MAHGSHARLVVILAGSISLVGCSATTTPGDPGLSATSSVISVPTFVAPHDPAMGAVTVIVPSVEVAAPEAAILGDLGQAVRSQLITSLASSPNFRVADRELLAEIASEQKLNASNATLPDGRPSLGQLVPARYAIKVTVNEFQENVRGKSGGNRVELGPLLGIIGAVVSDDTTSAVLKGGAAANPTVGVGNEFVEGVVGLEVRVTDLETGTVVGATRALGKLSRKNSKMVLGIAGISSSSSEFQHSVLAQATRVAAEEATRQIHEMLRARSGTYATTKL